MGEGARAFNHTKHLSKTFYHNSCTCKYKNINTYTSLKEYQNKSKVLRAIMHICKFACVKGEITDKRLNRDIYQEVLSHDPLLSIIYCPVTEHRGLYSTRLIKQLKINAMLGRGFQRERESGPKITPAYGHW